MAHEKAVTLGQSSLGLALALGALVEITRTHPAWELVRITHWSPKTNKNSSAFPTPIQRKTDFSKWKQYLNAFDVSKSGEHLSGAGKLHPSTTNGSYKTPTNTLLRTVEPRFRFQTRRRKLQKRVRWGSTRCRVRNLEWEYLLCVNICLLEVRLKTIIFLNLFFSIRDSLRNQMNLQIPGISSSTVGGLSWSNYRTTVCCVFAYHMTVAYVCG